MIEFAVAVQPNGWPAWIENAANLKFVRSLECPGELLNTHRDLFAAADHQGLHWVHVRDMAPRTIGRHAGEGISYEGLHWHDVVADLMKSCAALGVRSVSLDAGLDRISESGFDEAFQRRLALLEPVLLHAGSWGLRLCVEVRQPVAFPGSREWSYAGNLLYELRDHEVALCVNVAPVELAGDFDMDTFARRCALRTSVIRLMYYPHRGESPGDEMLAAWWKALRRHGFHGVVVFCPRVDDPDALPGILSRVDQWAAAGLEG